VYVYVRVYPHEPYIQSLPFVEPADMVSVLTDI